MFKNRTETLVFVSLPVGSDGGIRRVICMMDGSEGMSSRLVLSDAFGVVTSNIVCGDGTGELPPHLGPKLAGSLSDFLRGHSRIHSQLTQYGLVGHGLLTAVRAILYCRNMSGLDAVVRALEISRKAAAYADYLPGVPEMSSIPDAAQADTAFAQLA